MQRSAGRDPDAARGSMETDEVRPCDGSELEGLYRTLEEYRSLEGKMQPRLCLPSDPESGEVSAGARDGAAHVMRCLRMWFDLPPDVLLHAVNLLDRFLTKMKVRPCHVPCISVSCMNLAIEEHGLAVPVDELVSISQCGCTRGDVARMSAVVRSKLWPAGGASALTALHWLRLLAALAGWAARGLGAAGALARLYKEREVASQLEMVVCDATCANLRACELALVLFFNHLESAEEPSLQPVLGLAGELARLVGARDLPGTRALALAALQRCSARTEHRQRLVWRLSSRTLKVLRPTDRFMSRLPTIEEQNQSGETPVRPRTGSESSDDLSEESKDWPRSPVLPVYCE